MNRIPFVPKAKSSQAKAYLFFSKVGSMTPKFSTANYYRRMPSPRDYQ